MNFGIRGRPGINPPWIPRDNSTCPVFCFFLNINLFIYLAVLGLRCCVQAFL